MFKRLSVIIMCVILFSGCIARQELRPQENTDEIWVCEEVENTYFYWDEEKDAFLGNVAYKDESYSFVLGGSYGNSVKFYALDVLQEESNSEDMIFLRGFTDYQKGIMPVEIADDKLNIFNGEITTLTFVCKDKAEYFENLEQ